MANPSNESNQENSTFYDQADGKFNKAIERSRGTINPDRLMNGVAADDEELSGGTYSKNLMNHHTAEEEVRENEDASLQDESYAFDEENTDIEEYHDADDSDLEDFDLDNDDDFVQ